MEFKTQTATGKPVAKFTLLCDFKPQHQRANPATGEVKERWTYRSDLENNKHATAHDGYGYTREIDALGNVYKLHAEKIKRARLFDNRKEQGAQLLAEWKDGKLVYPYDAKKRADVLNWINKIQ